jgi:hypothetical protein
VEDGEEEDMEESREDSTSQSTNSEMITDKLLGIDQAILKSIESCSELNLLFFVRKEDGLSSICFIFSRW